MDYGVKLEEMLRAVNSTSDMRARSDLFKIYQNCKVLYIELDKEKIQCRRRCKITTGYQEIEQKLKESINEFDHWITFARLLYI